MKTKTENNTRRFAPSQIVCVRFHDKELKKIDKARKLKTRSEHIRQKTLV